MFLILQIESWSNRIANYRVSLQMEVRSTSMKHWRVKHSNSTRVHDMSLATCLFLSNSSGIQYNLKCCKEFEELKKKKKKCSKSFYQTENFLAGTISSSWQQSIFLSICNQNVQYTAKYILSICLFFAHKTKFNCVLVLLKVCSSVFHIKTLTCFKQKTKFLVA